MVNACGAVHTEQYPVEHVMFTNNKQPVEQEQIPTKKATTVRKTVGR